MSSLVHMIARFMEKLQILAVKRKQTGFSCVATYKLFNITVSTPLYRVQQLTVSTKILCPHLLLTCNFKKKKSSNFNAVALQNDHLNGLLMGDTNIFVFYFKQGFKRDPHYEILHIWKKYIIIIFFILHPILMHFFLLINCSECLW